MLTDASRQADFPSLSGMTYLNTAAESIPPRAVELALQQYAADKRLGMDGRDHHFRQFEEAKAQAAALYGLTAAEIGICSCSSEAFNLAASALNLTQDDEVVVNELDFPAGCTPWLHPHSPAKVKLWRHRDGVLETEDLAALLSPRTRLVSSSLVSFWNGFKIPLPQVIDITRRCSPALIALDVTQAAGRIPLQLDGVDLVISSTHKWLLGTHGGCLVGVPAARAAEWTVPAGGWHNLEDPFGPDRFTVVRNKPGAAGFTVGMPSFPAVYAINAALRYLHRIGIATIAAHADPLVTQCLQGLQDLHVDLLSPARPDSLAGILAFRHPDAERIHRQLHQRSIHIMHHAGRLRIALHGYNTPADVDTLLRALREAFQ